MAEKLRDLLNTLEADALERIAVLREQLAPLERELADIRRAKAALPPPPDTGPRLWVDTQAVQPISATRQHFIPVMHPQVAAALPEREQSPYAKLTMKELVLKALAEQFPGGAAAKDLLDFFANAWGRGDVVRTSLSPQLSRLKEEGKIVLNGLIWRLAGTAADEAANEHDYQEPLGLEPITATDP
ncbi:MAG TPA: hypothetical protein VEZ41_16520 [Allosphingosinicella sp.]|nr:hypothetical protein [Allosphingosinicella sp.]